MLLAGSSPALSQTPSPPPATPQAAIRLGPLLSRIYNGATLDRYLEGLRGDFFQLDADSDGRITQRDVDLHTLMESIQMRTLALNFVMRFDLDGDGAVTEDEARRALKYDMRMQLGLAAFNAAGSPILAPQRPEKLMDDTVRSVMALDTDNDGKVNSAEAGKYVLPGFRGSGPSGQAARARQALTSDFSTKGEVTLADYQAAGEAQFRKVDSDGDGKISQQELTESRRQSGAPDGAARDTAPEAAQRRLRAQADAARKAQEEAEAARAGCALPAPSPRAKVILLSAYETEALSSVSIGPQEAVVHAGRIVVEPGEEPLYVLIPTYSATIWQFSGAVERIERLAMSSLVTGGNRADKAEPPLVGATGIPKEKISFFARSGCLGYFSEVPSSQSIQTAAAVRQVTGQEPFKVASAYSVSGISIPSGKVEALGDISRKKPTLEKGAGAIRFEGDISNIILRAGPSGALDDLYRYSPGGLVGIDPASVVANLPVRTYEVLPQEAGLVQLLESGALRRNRAGEYIVQKQMRFPAGLHGAHSVKFLVLRGTPVPDGDPGHSCVVVEDQNSERKFAPCR
jgi:Ca2+-binding EF-hand superfamily protein